MSAPLRAAARALRGQAGYSLVELLVASMMALMLIAVGSTVMIAVNRSQPGQSDRGTKILNARTTMERLTRELRQGATIYTATANQLSFLTYVHSTCTGASSSVTTQCKVTYTCTAGSCTRTVGVPPPSTTSGPARTVVSGLSSSNVFGYGTGCSSSGSSSSGYVCATLTFPSQNGDDAITLQDGAALVNPPPA